MHLQEEPPEEHVDGRELSRRTKSNQQIGFLKLPAEIRNMIHAYSLAGTEYVVQWQYRRDPEVQFEGRENNRLALIRTCRQIHHEAGRVHASLSTFRFRGYGYYFWTPPLGATTVVLERELYCWDDGSLVKSRLDAPIGVAEDLLAKYVSPHVNRSTLKDFSMEEICWLPDPDPVRAATRKQHMEPTIRLWLEDIGKAIMAARPDATYASSAVFKHGDDLTLPV